MIEHNPQIQNLIGNSLVGSVNAQLIKDDPDRNLTLTTPTAPLLFQCQTKKLTTTTAYEILEMQSELR